MQCTAKAKQTGERCKRQVTPGRTVCYYHGGRIPRGAALPQTTRGRYSRDLPTRMMARYEQAQSDGELLALRDEIALLDSRLADVLTRVDTGESGWIWQRLKETATELRIARRRNDQGAQADALNSLLSLVESGHQDYAAWSDVRSLLEQRRRTVESERKRLVEMQQTITAERALLLIGAITGIVKAHVSEPKQLAAIARDIGALLDRGGDQGSH